MQIKDMFVYTVAAKNNAQLGFRGVKITYLLCNQREPQHKTNCGY
jgi:hypothetical protein